ncbi:GntR family transcriptional regulator [Falsigemmobacter faecalis]|uniref:GntR family transcriptional regulator n=1 Tax=Falsigemmobacter faecalis TaxID=2488730 RepID=UPI0018F5EC72|nr:GntR family transcriptional regulator [Falsigemmobacter faecalis]
MSDPRRPGVGEGLYHPLRGDIIQGRLAPGAKLRLEQLRESCGVAASTLREVLSRLASDGFVRTEGQRGFQVAPISAEGLHEIAGLRFLPEEHALARSFSRGTLEWKTRVIAAHHRLDSHEERLEAGHRSDISLWREAGGRFHQELISACGSAVMMQTPAGVFDK